MSEESSQSSPLQPIFASIRSSSSQLFLYTLQNVSLDISTFFEINNKYFSQQNHLQLLQSSYNKRYDSPLSFDDSTQHINFIFLQSLLHFVHCLCTKTENNNEIDSNNTISSPNDVVMFGLLGLYMTLPSLNQADLLQVDLQQLSQLFNIPCDEEYLIQEAVHGYRKSPLYPLINAYYLTLSNAGKKLFALHFDSFEQYLSSLLKKIQRQLQKAIVDLPSRIISEQKSLPYVECSNDLQKEYFLSLFANFISQDFPSFHDAALVSLDITSQSTTQNAESAHENDVKVVEVHFYSKLLILLQDLTVQYPAIYSQYLPQIQSYPLIADYNTITFFTSKISSSISPTFISFGEEDDNNNNDINTNGDNKEYYSPIVSIKKNIYQDKLSQNSVIRAACCVIGELQCLFINHNLSHPQNIISTNTTIKELLDIYQITIDTDESVTDTTTTTDNNDNKLSLSSSIEELFPFIINHFITTSVFMTNQFNESISIDPQEYHLPKHFQQLVNKFYEENQTTFVNPSMLHFWYQQIAQKYNLLPGVDLDTNENCSF